MYLKYGEYGPYEVTGVIVLETTPPEAAGIFQTWIVSGTLNTNEKEEDESAK